jgi:hypothetical protein
MSMNRRGLLGGMGLGLAAGGALAQETAPKTAAEAAKPALSKLEERLIERARQNRLPLTVGADGGFSGPAWDLMVKQGGQGRFFLIGEDHGVAQNPALAAALFRALRFDKVVVEISPPMAEEVDRVLSGGGIEAFRRFSADPANLTAFFTMKEEAAWIADARQAAPAGKPFLWGVDYEVGADRNLIARLKTKPMPAGARTALAALDAASQASWAKYDQTRQPQYMYTFTGDPELVRAVRNAWPKPDAQAAAILDTLETTFDVNRAWVQGRNWDSNRLRSQNIRTNFLRHWRKEAAAGRKPRVLFKMGAYHLARGLTGTAVFDLGSLAHEIAAVEGFDAFSMLVTAAPGGPTAQYDPAAGVYRTTSESKLKADGLDVLAAAAAFEDGPTLIDLRALRPLLNGAAIDKAPALARAVHGFDAWLILKGSPASTNL